MIFYPSGTYAIMNNENGGPDLIRIVGSELVIKAFPFKKYGYSGVDGGLYIVFDAYATNDGKIKTVLKYYIK